MKTPPERDLLVHFCQQSANTPNCSGPHWSGFDELIPPQLMGIRLFPICAHFSEEDAVMWKAETGIVEIPDEVRKWLRKQTYVSNRAEVIRQMLSTQVEWPDGTDILLADMPPSTASEVFSFFENIDSLLGVGLITRLSEISALGMTGFVRLRWMACEK